MKCKIMPQSWAKRRPMTAVVQPVHVTLSGFKYVDNSYCEMDVKFEDGTTKTLDGRIMMNCSYRHDLTPFNERWTVQGLTPDGINVVVKVEEDNE